MQAEAGFTLIEVLASAVIVTVMALGVLGGIDETTRSSYDIRLHTDAQALAHMLVHPDLDVRAGDTCHQLSHTPSLSAVVAVRWRIEALMRRRGG